MNKLIETIVSEVVNTLVKKGYSANQPNSGIASEQNQEMSGCACDQEKGQGGGGGQGQGWRGGRGGGRGKGSRGGCNK
jgi:uncharacterized membrane protein